MTDEEPTLPAPPDPQPPESTMRFLRELEQLDAKGRRARLREAKAHHAAADPGRQALRRAAFEAGVEALRENASATWWKELAPLSKVERVHVITHAHQYLQASSAFQEKPTD